MLVLSSNVEYAANCTFLREYLSLSKNTGANSVSGFFAAACSLPFDYVKTQIQKMQPDAEGKLPYLGSFDCAMKTLKAGGPFKFYTGFSVYCVRIAPHVMFFDAFKVKGCFKISVVIDTLSRGRKFRNYLEVGILEFYTSFGLPS
ncbi:Mitochondrial dicarboxylate/tricarboxylate transporter DTC [Capsicum baccatum]|uniref:Mitochondrial dicarboxylate/tricarboxylate transporter DTC n=1 Tax=Capsicum baccatum TaxID=33114 RepID=A0A2G2V8T2_CAPBA|nr:Mitochondrial dicarboxylate/tricarboxylate transporter DTC [Capsicum baccatum]